jgi:fluoride exporter
MIFKHIILVGIGGMIGSVARYIFSVLIKHNTFPFATYTVNIIGCFVIGMVMGLAHKQEDFGDWRLFLATGICGGFTTFSAFSWECVSMLQQQRYVAVLAYVSGSLLLGFSATLLGYWLLK